MRAHSFGKFLFILIPVKGHIPPPPQKKWACSQKSGDDFTGGLSVRTIFAQKIPSKIVFCFRSAFYNAEKNKSNVSSIQASKRNIPGKNTPAKIHSVPRRTIKKKLFSQRVISHVIFPALFILSRDKKPYWFSERNCIKNTVQRVFLSPQVWLP